MRARSVLAVLTAAALSFSLAACGSDSEKKENESKGLLERISANQKIVVGIKYDQPSLGLKQPDGTFAGFDVDVARFVAKELGVPESGIEFKETVSANRETFLESGQVDIVVATYSITESRKPKVTFAGPYYVAHQDTMVLTGDTKIQKAADLKGKKLCRAAGSNSYKRVVEGPPDGQLNIPATLVDATSYSDCVAKLKAKALDAVTTDDLILAGFASQQKGDFKVINDPFSDEKYGIGLKKGDIAACQKINEAVAKLYSAGEAGTLLNKHFSGAGLKLVTTQPPVEGCA
ncbi:glutamate ABC transporter substrate-binding protein [Actinocorallia lasiicapitis]